jgi:hypothetical protein
VDFLRGTKKAASPDPELKWKILFTLLLTEAVSQSMECYTTNMRSWKRGRTAIWSQVSNTVADPQVGSLPNPKPWFAALHS